MVFSKLKLDPDKSEFIVLGSKAQHQKLTFHFPVSILGSLTHPADIVKNLFLSQNKFERLVKPASSRCVTLVELDNILLKKWLSLLQCLG